MKKAYWRRLRRNWRWNLRDLYYKAFAVVGITLAGTLIALLVNERGFASLPLSLVDARPWMFFLFSWTVMRGIQLGWSELFGDRVLNGRMMRYVWSATIDALVLMMGSFCGVVLALIVRGVHQGHENIISIVIVMAFALFFPFALAFGLVDMQRQGFTRRVKRWFGVGVGAFMLIWLFLSSEMHPEQAKKTEARCAVNTSDVRRCLVANQKCSTRADSKWGGLGSN